MNVYKDDKIKEQQQQQKHDEILFWRVFHNKYIRHYIMDQINKLEIEGERMKFKKITSLEFLIEHRQHQLLRCKLEANEYIEISYGSLYLLLEPILIIRKDYDGEENRHPYIRYGEHQEYFKRNEYKKGDEFIDNDKANEINSLSSRQSFSLLLKYKSIELLKFNLLELVAEIFGTEYYKFNEYTTELIDELLSSKQYNDVNNNDGTYINPYIIEMVIKHCPPLILDKLLNHLKKTNNFDNIITQNVKNNSISWVGSQFKDEMFEYILNNDRLYSNNANSPQPTRPSDKDFESPFLIILPMSNNNDNTIDQIVKLNPEEFSNIKSPAIKIKLFQLGYFYINNTQDQNEKEFKDRISSLLNINDEESKFKKIFQFFTRQSPINYIEYILKYGELSDQLEIDVTHLWLYSIGHKSVNGLQCLFSKVSGTGVIDTIDKYSKKIDHNIFIKNNFPKYQIKPEFIKLYTIGYKHFQHRECDKQILNYLYTMKSNHQQLESLLNSIVITLDNKKFTRLISLKWWDLFDINQIKSSKRFIIQDTNTIDTIFNHFEQFKLLHKYLTNIIVNIQFKFESFQLIDYAKSKYGPLFFNHHNSNESFDIINESFYLYPFTKAINNCDIESLQYIDQLLGNRNIKFYKFEGDKSIYQLLNYSETILKKIKEVKDNIKYHSCQVKIHFIDKIGNGSNYNSEENIIKLLEYLNSSGYKLFSSKLFKKFINDISKLQFLNNFKINFKQFQSESLELVLHSISNTVDPNVLQLVLNNINPFEIENSNSIFTKWENNIDQLSDSSYYVYGKVNSDNSFGMRGKFTNFTQSTLFYIPKDNQGNEELETPCYSYESSNDIISCIELILNHFRNNSKSSSIHNPSYGIIQKLINYLFKRLIKVYQVNIDRVKRVYQFIKSNWLSITGIEFRFQHSLYHIFYYLSIRSLKFNEYIQSRYTNSIVKTLEERAFDNQHFHFEHLDYFTKRYTPLQFVANLPKFQLFQSFSYDFIFNTQLDQLIDELEIIKYNIQDTDLLPNDEM